ncbi:MAG TPA: glycoside hydrolase domain-containing protein [Armatimonadota bacterium]|jgi:hypothetical protein
MKRPVTIAVMALVAAAVLGILAARPRAPRYANAPGMKLWIASDTVKVRPTAAPRPDSIDAKLAAARHEVASFQAVVTADRVPLTVTDVRLSTLKGPNGRSIGGEAVELFREAFYKVTTPSLEQPRGDEVGEWPDALIPIGADRYYHERRLGTPFTVASGRCQPLWVDIRVPDDAAPGDYEGELTVHAEGRPDAVARVTLHVWDFALPKQCSLQTAFGFGGGTRLQHGLPPEEMNRLTRLYARELVAHDLSPWGLWFTNGLPLAVYDPNHPENGASIQGWDRIDDLYGEVMAGTPEGRANAIDVPPAAVLKSALDAPVVTADAKPNGGLLAAGQYVYRVTAVNENGETEGSRQTLVQVPANGAVTLSWPAVRNNAYPTLNPTHYTVYRSRGPVARFEDEFDSFRLDQSTGGSYTDDGLRAPDAGKPCPFSNSTGDRECVAIYAAWAKHFQQKGWLDRAWFYATDEPFAKRKLAEGRRQSLLWRKAVPNGWSLVTNTFSPELEGAVNEWVVVVNWIDDPERCSPAVIRQHQAKGERVWWYQGLMSRAPGLSRGGRWPSMYIDDDAMALRVDGAMTWRYGFDGMLYYMVDMAYAQKNNDPWQNQFFYSANGDGTFFYPGTPVRVGGSHPIPITTLRLKLLRQSMQDYEYMKRVSDLGDKGIADRAAARIVAAPDRYWTDTQAEALPALRAELARRIEELQRSHR